MNNYQNGGNNITNYHNDGGINNYHNGINNKKSIILEEERPLIM